MPPREDAGGLASGAICPDGEFEMQASDRCHDGFMVLMKSLCHVQVTERLLLSTSLL